MKSEQLELLLDVAGATKNAEGWHTLKEDRLVTLYAASNGAHLTVARVQAISWRGELLVARTTKGEQFVLALVDLYAGALEAAPASGRKAGFQAPG